MKAVVWKSYNQLVYSNVQEPQCTDDSVKIKVMSAGVCATDVHVISGNFDNGKPPHILGHEICGEIVEIGKNVQSVQAGDRVVVETAVGCGQCVYCRTGNKHLCINGGEIGFPPFAGGYAQYVAAPENCVRRIPETISNDAGAILEAVACPAGAVYRIGLKPDDTVLIQGAGIAGLSFVQTARAFGAKKVIVAARNETRLDFARKFGADITINTKKENLSERVQEETGGRGADLSIEAAGAPATIEQAIKLVKKNGKVILYGIPDDTAEVSFPVKEMIMNQITAYGVTNNELVWEPLIDLVAAGRIQVNEMVTHCFPLRELDEAVELLKRHPDDLIKAVVHPWEI